MAIQFLFIYGTLLEPGNGFALYLQENSTFYDKGKFKGKLYDIGEYPGAVLNKSGKSYVHGSIVLLNNNHQPILRTIDNYEGYGPKQPKPNLYIRQMIAVETDVGPVKCWVYLYNRPVIGLHQITSGDYLDYKSKKIPPDANQEG